MRALLAVALLAATSLTAVSAVAQTQTAPLIVEEYEDEDDYEDASPGPQEVAKGVYRQSEKDDGPAEPFLAFCVEQAVVGFKSISLESKCRQHYRLPIARNLLCEYYQRSGFVSADDVFACAAFRQINLIVKARNTP